MHPRIIGGIAAVLVSTSLAASSNTFLRRAPDANGTVIVKMTGSAIASPTDSFILKKQVFTGSTDCTSGAGPMQYVAGISATSTDSIPLTSIDSVLLTPFPRFRPQRYIPGSAES